MNRLQSIIAYLCIHYPYPSELSNSRLTKLVYLADWFSALADDEQLTNINWLFNHYGPYVDDVKNAVLYSHNFSLHNDQNIFGSNKNVIMFHGDDEEIRLSDRDKRILDLVIDKTKGKYYNEFIDYVYSTYPVQSQNRYSNLDLIRLAREYKINSIRG
ncbi:TPA: SocA family protein [Acinetobacter baumannii]|uniref:Panacea domain-containing protein n=1 Tax=Acinetobacter baumannii TaxID=470 RepID=UPI000297A687|nr:Panacea domain-containing protein [Acinetobacter baumannii]EHU1924478.1 SocA family protein [Acinetobacter baumannii]EHU1989861.1 SocA family protein [Acinetobacter baumannii]EHU2639524.1 SocA family protein [Acinetobacter baumannii]EHU3111290.1 SocA family protein [Acinetobacter baumannii]EKP37780.1 PF13274 family protein [Acinetobacter baumannii OIFC065]